MGRRLGPARLPTASGLATPIYTPTASVAVTVLRLKAEDPRATDAFDAAQVLREAKGVNLGVLIGAGVLIATVIVLVIVVREGRPAGPDAPVAIPQCTRPGRRSPQAVTA